MNEDNNNIPYEKNIHEDKKPFSMLGKIVEPIVNSLKVEIAFISNKDAIFASKLVYGMVKKGDMVCLTDIDKVRPGDVCVVSRGDDYVYAINNGIEKEKLMYINANPKNRKDVVFEAREEDLAGVVGLVIPMIEE